MSIPVRTFFIKKKNSLDTLSKNIDAFVGLTMLTVY